MTRSDDLKRSLWPMMTIFILTGLVFIFIYHLVPHSAEAHSFGNTILHTLRELGMGLLVAGTVGLVFEFLAHAHLIGSALSDVEKRLLSAESKQADLLDKLEVRVNRVGDEIVMASGMLRNATKVGIEAVYNGREEEFHRDLATSLRDAKGTVRILGISLADMTGYYGGKSRVHEEVENRMTNDDPSDKLQILFSNPDEIGLKTRAKYEHPGKDYEDTRAYKQTVNQIGATLAIAKAAIGTKKVEVRLYDDTPLCFLVITEDRLFVEHYHYASRGGQNLILAIKGKTGLFRFYEDHFDALWRDAHEPDIARYAPFGNAASRTAVS